MTTASVGAVSPSAERHRFRVQGVPVRRWLRTTPGTLRVWSVVLVAVLLVLGLVAATASIARVNAARSVASDAAPELVSAEVLYHSLADADATASIIFLKAGQEAPALRQRYERDLREAGHRLTNLSNSTNASADERAAVDTIAKQLPTYAGYIEAARANSRLGYPVGAAYLREASTLMRQTLLPAATTVYAHGALRLDSSYRRGASVGGIALVAVVGLIAAVLLVAAQIVTLRRSNRLLNVGLVVATIVVLGLVAGTSIRFASAQDELVDAQRTGSDSLQLLSVARITALQAQADENTALIERGGGKADLADFDANMDRLGGEQSHGKDAGILAEARTVAARTGRTEPIDALVESYRTLQRQHIEVRAQDTGGDYTRAVALATSGEASTFTSFDAATTAEIEHAQARVHRNASDASRGFAALVVAIVALVALAIAAVAVGLQRRIGEYR